MKKLLIANWKMNIGCKDGAALAIKFVKSLKITKNKKFIILPTYESIYYIRNKVGKKSFFFGAQDCSQFSKGAFTGDVSASMLKEIGCDYVLIGHSERRSIYNEDKKILIKKIKNAVLNNLKIIFCVGEDRVAYKTFKTKQVIQRQLSRLFTKKINFKNLIIAYEPVWAIGSNQTPSLGEIENVHGYIKKFFLKNYDVKNICVIYGGSVNLNNSKDIFKTKNVDGGLIGGASLKADDFKKIYDNLN